VRLVVIYNIAILLIGYSKLLSRK